MLISTFESEQWPPEMIFLLYSPAIAVLRQLCQLAIKFHSFIFAFDAPPGTVAVEIARSVIDEMTNTNRSGFNLTQWAQFLDELPKKIDGTIDGTVLLLFLSALDQLLY